MRKSWLVGILSAAMLLSLTGCWDREELNEIGIILALAIDKDKDNVRITTQVVVPSEVASKSANSSGLPVTLYQASGRSLHEAIEKISQISPRTPYLSHIRVLVFSEQIAHEGIFDTLEALLREPAARPDFYVLVARHTTAASILNVMTPLDRIPANKLYNSLQLSSKSWAPTLTATSDQLMEGMVDEGIEPVITGVQIRGNASTGGSRKNLDTLIPSAQLVFAGIGAFKNDKLIGWMNDDLSKGYNYITDNVKSTVGHVNCINGKGVLTMTILRSDTHMSARMIDNKPVIDIKVTNTNVIDANECTESLTDNLKAYEKAAEDVLVTLMENSVRNAQKNFKADIFGFGQAIDRDHHAVWQQLSKDWGSQFASLRVNYKAEVNIKRIGTFDDSIKDKLKE